MHIHRERSPSTSNRVSQVKKNVNTALTEMQTAAVITALSLAVYLLHCRLDSFNDTVAAQTASAVKWNDYSQCNL